MRRIKLVLAALSVAVASFAAFAGPVLADDLDCRDARGDLIRCDGDLYAPYYNHHDNYDHYYHNDNYFDYYFNPYLFFSPYNYYGGFDDDYSYGCEGPVCLIDQPMQFSLKGRSSYSLALFFCHRVSDNWVNRKPSFREDLLQAAREQKPDAEGAVG